MINRDVYRIFRKNSIMLALLWWSSNKIQQYCIMQGAILAWILSGRMLKKSTDKSSVAVMWIIRRGAFRGVCL